MRAIAAVLLLTATPFKRGSHALLQRDWQTAVAAFAESIQAEPTAKAYVKRGIANGRLGKLRNECAQAQTALNHTAGEIHLS